MKTCKKFLAVLLSILMMLSVTVISASAEEDEVWICIDSVKAVKYAEGDKETVTQLEMTLHASNPAVTFDTLNSTTAFPICEGLFAEATYFLAETLGEIDDDMPDDEYIAKVKEILGSAEIGSVKPVSFAEGVLTLDVFSKDGSVGLKMVSFNVLGENFDGFIFEFPAGLLKDSASGRVNIEDNDASTVEGLAARTLELPYLASMIIAAIVTGNYASLLILLPLLPFLIIVVPIMISSLISRIEKAYNAVYDLDVSALLKKAVKALRQMLPYIIAELF